MSAPSIIKVSPNPDQIDVVLGSTIVVTFDQLIDVTTVTSSTFSLTGPGQSQVVSPEELNSKFPRPASGREYIAGLFQFSTNTDGNTVVTFAPSRPLRPNVVYTVLLVGTSLTSALGAAIKNVGGELLDATNQWSFTTGGLNLSVPPVSSPLAPLVLPLDPANVKIRQKLWAVGNDLSQEIDIIFPASIDTSTVTVDQILLSLEPILNDPSVAIPTGLSATVTITDNKIAVVVSGWPMS